MTDQSQTVRAIEAEEIPRLLARLRHDESAATLQLKILLAMGSLSKVLGVRPFRRHAFEYSFGGGRADLVLFHRDFGVTIVEAKAGGGAREMAAGIGQLFLYQAEAMRKFKGVHAPKYINKILCAPVRAEDSMSVWTACNLAGVKFVHLQEFKPFKESLTSMGLVV